MIAQVESDITTGVHERVAAANGWVHIAPCPCSLFCVTFHS
jgi:hypothetical protein